MESLNNDFFLKVWGEKIKSKGEDAHPLCLSKQDISVIGVCDGMGGAGSKLYTNNNSKKSGAAIAATTVSKTVTEYFLNVFNEESFEFDIDKLKKLIKEQLHEISNLYKEEKTLLKSKLISSFPTTLAILLLFKRDEKVEVTSIWAGDSRNFTLTKNGLLQLSKDDLRIDNDPLENIYNDSPLSNFIKLEDDFKLNHTTFEIEKKNVFFSATDGCFQFYKSPMHFELMLLKTLSASNSVDEWKLNIEKELHEISGDDFSMALETIEFKNFDSIKKYYQDRCDLLQNLLIDIDHIEVEEKKLENTIEHYQKEIIKSKQKKKEKLLQVWKEYKKEYYKKVESYVERGEH
ncbi:PP2C family serine/threonine-protein phosphatase [Tenacibaculum amylolyticum]|uniref:hypothetical protein n=1 Tax=Tenacibaculum amylolyticum TaxID=104269 RepID=UPI0038956A0B